MDQFHSNPPTGLPKGSGIALTFAIWNGLSSQLVLAGPIVLYAKSLGASATVLGILSGLMPILVIFQIPAAQHVGRVGYRLFMLRGWSARVVFVFLMTLVPLLSNVLDPPNRLLVLLALVFGFNLLRGLASCAWLPWVMELIPESLRGRFLTSEQFCVNLAGALAFGFAALLVGHGMSETRYAWVFGFSAISGLISLEFLRRVPDLPVPPEDQGGRGTIPWLELAAYPPFRALLRLNGAYALSSGGMLTFITAFLRSHENLDERVILVVLGSFFLGGLISPWLAGSRLDRLGSRPALRLALGLGAILSLVWSLVAGGVWKLSPVGIAPFVFFLGTINAVFSAAQNRLAMHTAPKMGRSHFFALYSVVLNVTLGLSPILGGLWIDVLNTQNGHLGRWAVNGFSTFFLITSLLFIVACILAGRVQEPKAASTELLLRELLVDEPRKALNRLWIRT